MAIANFVTANPVALRLAAPRPGETTLSRFRTSRHLAELRHVLVLLVPAAVVALGGGFILLDAAPALTFAGAVLAASCGVAVWLYRTANDWLGLVDLFSGEISTLCRVCTVADVIKRYADHLDTPDDPGFAKIAPSEIYTIIFDTNSRQLSVFDKSVIRNVTQFYTYIKAFRDATRGLVALHHEKRPQDAEECKRFDGAWRGLLINNVFVLFLALESGRGAIDELVEDRALLTEWVMTVLLSEFAAYAFLLEHHRDDFKADRLELRYARYQELNARIAVESQAWPESKALLEELERRWQAVEQAWQARQVRHGATPLIRAG